MKKRRLRPTCYRPRTTADQAQLAVRELLSDLTYVMVRNWVRTQTTWPVGARIRGVSMLQLRDRTRSTYLPPKKQKS